MAQHGLDSTASALEEWYSMYMSMTDFDACKALKSLLLDPIDLAAFEGQIVDTAREVAVVDGFCVTCRSMLHSWPDFELDKTPLDETGAIRADLPCQGHLVERMAAAKIGCKCCVLILICIEDANVLETYIKSHIALHKLGKSSQIHMRITFFPSERDGEPFRDERSKFYFAGLSLPGRSYDPFGSVYFQIFPVSSDFPRSFSPPKQLSRTGLVKCWAETCLRSHEKCNADRPSQYPTRLLSIATESTRLVSTTGWTEAPKYATLSHCWGRKHFETLRSDNLQQMHNRIPQNMLTKTFTDAIELARGVGLEYLWIDSWCIIQDDYEDWGREAARMSSVYGGSSLNIAASSARDGTEGLFPRPGDHPGGFQAEVSSGERKQLHHFIFDGYYNRLVNENPLAFRAWAFQEKILSPRTVHCSNQGMFWECRTAMASKDSPDGFGNSGAGSSLSHKSKLFRPVAFNSWTSLVERYSRCHLTNPGDKLVALSGIASLFRDKNQDQYVAGIFRENLEADLAWRVLEPQQRPAYRAPSWSWAAVDGPIHFISRRISLDKDSLYIRARSISVETTGTDSCGPVARGSLRLDCKMIRQGTVKGTWPSVATEPLSPEERRKPLYTDLGHPDILFPFYLDCAAEQYEWLGHAVCYIPILAGKRFHHHADACEGEVAQERKTIAGLVVKGDDSPRQNYQRIGYFEYHSCERCDREENLSTIAFFSEFMGLRSSGHLAGGLVELV